MALVLSCLCRDVLPKLKASIGKHFVCILGRLGDTSSSCEP